MQTFNAIEIELNKIMEYSSLYFLKKKKLFYVIYVL